jgi:bis(5'-nucleosidyl)-tetraphosphatase
VIVRRDGGELRYLLLRAFRHWDFPKGGIDAGEEPLAAALREVEEETTLTGLRFPWGEAYRETAPYAGGKVARYYLAEPGAGAGQLAGHVADQVRLPVSPELGRPEHHEFRWLPYEQARALLGERLQPILDWADATVRGLERGGG